MDHFLEEYGSAQAFEEEFGYKMPTTISELHPMIHYTMEGHNEVGMDASRNSIYLINKLDDKYRDVILLKSMGVDNQTIAEIMHISDNLVSQRYKRAKKQLWQMGGKDLYAE